MSSRREFLRTSAAGIGAVTLAGCSELTNVMDDEDDRPIQAHRCFADDYPENTRLAAERAAAVADQLEIDVRRCGTGELVVFHDETVDDKTDGSGTVAEMPWAELRELRVLGSDERIPLLSEMYDVVPTDVAVNVELKQHDIARDVLDIAADYEHDTILSAIQPTIVMQADDARRDDEVEVALVFAQNPSEDIETALAMNCDRIHFGYRTLIRTNALEAAKQAGLWVNTGTLTSTHQYEVVREMAVDGFSGDTAETFTEAEPAD